MSDLNPDLASELGQELGEASEDIELSSSCGRLMANGDDRGDDRAFAVGVVRGHRERSKLGFDINVRERVAAWPGKRGSGMPFCFCSGQVLIV